MPNQLPLNHSSLLEIAYIKIYSAFFKGFIENPLAPQILLSTDGDISVHKISCIKIRKTVKFLKKVSPKRYFTPSPRKGMSRWFSPCTSHISVHYGGFVKTYGLVCNCYLQSIVISKIFLKQFVFVIMTLQIIEDFQ